MFIFDNTMQKCNLEISGNIFTKVNNFLLSERRHYVDKHTKEKSTCALLVVQQSLEQTQIPSYCYTGPPAVLNGLWEGRL